MLKIPLHRFLLVLLALTLTLSGCGQFGSKKSAREPVAPEPVPQPPAAVVPPEPTPAPEPDPQPVQLTLNTWNIASLPATAPQAEGLVIHGRIVDEKGNPVPGGVIGFERGRLHNNKWEVAAPIYPDGTYSIKMPDSGDWGMHIYADGFIYLPEQVSVGRLLDKRFDVTLVRQPVGTSAPTIGMPAMFKHPDGSLEIAMEATDPHEDLSPQVLALNITTGQAFLLLPPSEPIPEIVGVRFSQYPNGIYRNRVPASALAPGSQWMFVAANHHCAITPLRLLSLGS